MDEQTSTSLATVGNPGQLPVAPAAVMSNDEIDRVWRTADALARSGLYRDVQSAAQGFAKMLVGRTLGLNEHQSLSLYVMEGKVEIPYPLMGYLVRSRPSHDYRPAWIKEDEHGIREAVYVNEDTITDMRKVVGAALEFTVGGELRGISTWTKEDSEQANLTAKRGNKESNHLLYPRNMFLARAMSNGIKWYVPEVTAGVPVYAPGEIPRAEELTVGEGDGSEPGWGSMPIPLVNQINRVLRRAEKLSYGLPDVATLQMVMRDKNEAYVTDWVTRTTADLDKVKESVTTTATEEPASALGAEDAEGHGIADDPTEHITSLRAVASAMREEGNEAGASDADAQADALEQQAQGSSLLND